MEIGYRCVKEGKKTRRHFQNMKGQANKKDEKEQDHERHRGEGKRKEGRQIRKGELGRQG